jgi:hypothetical protein
MPEDDETYVIAASRQETGALHTDRDCPQLARADRIREVTRVQVPHRELCEICQADSLPLHDGSDNDSLGRLIDQGKLDPDDLATDGGMDATESALTPDGSPHYCHICETGFEEFARLVDHDCEPTPAGEIETELWNCRECDRDLINSTVNPERCPECGAARPATDDDT